MQLSILRFVSRISLWTFIFTAFASVATIFWSKNVHSPTFLSVSVSLNDVREHLPDLLHLRMHWVSLIFLMTSFISADDTDWSLGTCHAHLASFRRTKKGKMSRMFAIVSGYGTRRRSWIFELLKRHKEFHNYSLLKKQMLLLESKYPGLNLKQWHWEVVIFCQK